MSYTPVPSAPSKSKVRKPRRYAGTNIESTQDDPWFIRFKKARLRARLTQQELGELLGVSKTAIFYWEKGISFPSKGKMHIIQTILNENMFDYSGKIFKPSHAPDHVRLMVVFMTLSDENQKQILEFACQLASAQKHD